MAAHNCNRFIFLLALAILVFGFVAADAYAATYYRDRDGDKYGDVNNYLERAKQPKNYVANSLDCNDRDKKINPVATEVCGDKKDNNCDGRIDETCATTITNIYYRDADGDTYGSPTSTTTATSQPAGYVSNSNDCNDASSAINPSATEVCNAVDDNCVSGADENNVCSSITNCGSYGTACQTDANGAATCTGGVCGITCNTGYALENDVCKLLNIYYGDADGDTYGDAFATTTSTSQPIGYVSNSLDCNDGAASVHPGIAEVCGNGIDEDCSGADLACPTFTFYLDSDADSYGNPAQITQATSQPAGYTSNSLDCNDADATVNPDANEVCNSVDDNCNGANNEGLFCILSTFYLDADADSYGTSQSTTTAFFQPANYVSNEQDCNDADASINICATGTVCSDSTCKSLITYYADADGDNYGDVRTATTGVTVPAGDVTNGLDCSDSNFNINPGATEVCNGIDDNCINSFDEGGVCSTVSSCGTYGNVCSADANSVASCIGGVCSLTCNSGYSLVNGVCTVLNTYYKDSDGDGYGVTADTTSAQYKPIGYAALSGDCDDANTNVKPNNIESCDGLDNNCNLQMDEGGVCNTILHCGTYANACPTDPSGSASCTNGACSLTCSAGTSLVNGACVNLNVYYKDADADGFGTPTSVTSNYYQPAGYVSNSNDCNDANAGINPGAAETCDDLDNDCDNQIDEGLPVQMYYKDLDGDGYGDLGTAFEACAVASFSVTGAAVAPAGYITVGGDCNDAQASINPSATETCGNGIDEDCSGADLACPIIAAAAYTYYKDADADTYGSTTDTTTSTSTTPPSGYVTNNLDCSDANALINPAATEVCGNGIDEDCSGADLACPTPTCSDTDNGANYFAQGTCTDSAGKTFTDYCMAAAGTVVEFYCSSGTCAYESYGDSTGSCSSGAWQKCVPATEICGDGKDQDCDGADTACSVVNIYYKDADADTYGSTVETTTSTSTTAPAGYVSNNNDCNDNNAAIYLGATEICGNGIDEDCSGADLACTTNNLICTDSDGNGGYYTKGTCTDSTGTYTDYCQDDKTVRDYYCQGTYDSTGLISNVCAAGGMSKLSGSCIDGAWVDTTTPTCIPANGGVEICGNGIDEDCSGADLACPTINITTTTCAPTNNGIEICGNGIDEDCSGSDLACTTNVTTTTATPNIQLYIDVPSSSQQFAAGSTSTFYGWAADINGAYPTSVKVYIDSTEVSASIGARPDVCTAYPNAYECKQGTQLVGYSLAYTAPAVSASHTIKVTATAGSSTQTAQKGFSVYAACTPTNNGVEICGNGIDEDCSGSDLACSITNITTTTCTPTNGGVEICGNSIDEDCSGADLACQSCTDTDGGLDYYAAGTCTNRYGTQYTDKCLTTTTGVELYEYYCSADAVDCSATLHSETGYDCANGKLVPQTTTTSCTDSDGGKIYTTKGTCTDSTGSYTDSCPYSAWVKEYYCTSAGCASVDNTAIYYACSDGALYATSTSAPDLTATCTDSDGINYKTKGTCTYGSATYTDYCSGSLVVDYYCISSGCSTNKYQTTASLGESCVDGTLVKCTSTNGGVEICGNGIDEDCSGADLACPIATCTPSWTCTGWSACTDGQETRTCTDSNNCGTTDGKPAETQSCTPILSNATTGAATLRTNINIFELLLSMLRGGR